MLKENVCLFARPTATSHYRGSDCIRSFAKCCGADVPYSLTSTKLRKQAATLSTVLNPRDTDSDQLANFLGRDVRIHREYYRLPVKTLQLVKVSRVHRTRRSWAVSGQESGWDHYWPKWYIKYIFNLIFVHLLIYSHRSWCSFVYFFNINHVRQCMWCKIWP